MNTHLPAPFVPVAPDSAKPGRLTRIVGSADLAHQGRRQNLKSRRSRSCLIIISCSSPCEGLRGRSNISAFCSPTPARPLTRMGLEDPTTPP